MQVLDEGGDAVSVVKGGIYSDRTPPRTIDKMKTSLCSLYRSREAAVAEEEEEEDELVFLYSAFSMSDG